MNSNLSPAQNPPTIGAAAAAFWYAVVDWLVKTVNFDAGIEATGAALLIAVGVVVIGRITQRFTWPTTPIDGFAAEAEAENRG